MGSRTTEGANYRAKPGAGHTRRRDQLERKAQVGTNLADWGDEGGLVAGALSGEGSNVTRAAGELSFRSQGPRGLWGGAPILFSVQREAIRGGFMQRDNLTWSVLLNRGFGGYVENGL